MESPPENQETMQPSNSPKATTPDRSRNSSPNKSPIQDIIGKAKIATKQLEGELAVLKATTEAQEAELNQFVENLRKDAESEPTAEQFQKIILRTKKLLERDGRLRRRLDSDFSKLTELVDSEMSRLKLLVAEVQLTESECERILEDRKKELEAQQQQKIAETEEKKKRAAKQQEIETMNLARKERKKKEAMLRLQKKQQAEQAQKNKEIKQANRQAHKEAVAAKAAADKLRMNSRISFTSAAFRSENSELFDNEPSIPISSSTSEIRTTSPIRIGTTEEPQSNRRPLSKRQIQFVMTMPANDSELSKKSKGQ
ncbi:unnamed protein product [Caenorhabditis brenneri]